MSMKSRVKRISWVIEAIVEVRSIKDEGLVSDNREILDGDYDVEAIHGRGGNGAIGAKVTGEFM